AKNQRHILRVNILDVPTEIVLTVGDAFYNLRFALDQLVWALSRLKAIPPRFVQFPVIEDWNAKGTQDRFAKQLTGVCSEAISEIKTFQPYHRGTAYKSHPLWRLNELCNLDKHRRVPVDGHAAEIRFPNLTPSDI